MVNLDLTVTLGTIIETGVLGSGGIAALITLRNTVAMLQGDLKMSKQDVKEQFIGIQLELKKMGEILVTMARFEEKISNLDRRVTGQGRKLDDLSHGEGFVRSNRSSVEGEYP
jgi:hypothetical protein